MISKKILPLFVFSFFLLPKNAQAAWPDYQKALHDATVPNADEFVKNIKNSYKGPDWSDDGCSFPTEIEVALASYFGVGSVVLIEMAKHDFKNACIQHDFAYRNIPRFRQGRNDRVRSVIDKKFKGNMERVCKKKYGGIKVVLRPVCFSSSRIFYKSVDFFGGRSYYNTDQDY